MLLRIAFNSIQLVNFFFCFFFIILSAKIELIHDACAVSKFFHAQVANIDSSNLPMNDDLSMGRLLDIFQHSHIIKYNATENKHRKRADNMIIKSCLIVVYIGLDWMDRKYLSFMFVIVVNSIRETLFFIFFLLLCDFFFFSLLYAVPSSMTTIYIHLKFSWEKPPTKSLDGHSTRKKKTTHQIEIRKNLISLEGLRNKAWLCANTAHLSSNL